MQYENKRSREIVLRPWIAVDPPTTTRPLIRQIRQALSDDDKDDDDLCHNHDAAAAISQRRRIATQWMQSFQEALCTVAKNSRKSDHNNTLEEDVTAAAASVAAAASAVEQHFFVPPHDTLQPQPFWRDMVAFTWNIITLEGPAQIRAFLQSTDRRSNLVTSSWQLDVRKDLVVSNDNSNNYDDALEFWATFETVAGVGRAHVRLVHDTDGTWKARTLLTTLQELHDRPFRTAPYDRRTGIQHGPVANRIYWHEQQQQQQQQQEKCDGTDDDEEMTFVLIIGGGQGGLSLAARLQLLDIPYVVLEAGAAPGSAWRNRYPSLHLHDPVYYNHMPYLPFPVTWPVFAPRNKIATWLEFYASALDLNVRTRAKVVSAVLNSDANNQASPSGGWTVNIEQCDPSTKQVVRSYQIHTQHIVFATGNSSHPKMPVIPGRFAGLQLHSSQYKGGKHYAAHHFKHAVVIGSNNSAFDIVQDLWEQLSIRNGGSLQSITMIQRTPAMVVSTESVLQYGLGPMYAENAALHHEEADLVATTVPYKLARDQWKRVTDLMRENDADMLQALERAGFRLDAGPDGTGIFAKSATEGGGFYINVGGADLLIRGDVAVRYATVDRLVDDAVMVTHLDTNAEERLPADLLVHATGFGTMDDWVAELCGTDVADAVGRTWGLGLNHHPDKDPGPWEGELRNMWKPVTVEGLWFQGGNLAQNRHYSRYLALQLAARYLRMETKVYCIPPPTRRRRGGASAVQEET